MDADVTEAAVDDLLPCTGYLMTVTPFTTSSSDGEAAQVVARTEDADPGAPADLQIIDQV